MSRYSYTFILRGEVVGRYPSVNKLLMSANLPVEKKIEIGKKFGANFFKRRSLEPYNDEHSGIRIEVTPVEVTGVLPMSYDEAESDEFTTNLLPYSLVQYNGVIVEVRSVNTNFILAADFHGQELIFKVDECQQLVLTNDWFGKLGLKVDQIFTNPKTGDKWIIRSTSDGYYYLTSYREISGNENPLIPLHSVQELQHWYHLITGNYLRQL